jgi:hypothetical protein
MQGTGRAYEVNIVGTVGKMLMVLIERYDRYEATSSSLEHDARGTSPDPLLFVVAIGSSITLGNPGDASSQPHEGSDYITRVARTLESAFGKVEEVIREHYQTHPDCDEMVAKFMRVVMEDVRRRETSLNFAAVVSRAPRNMG